MPKTSSRDGGSGLGLAICKQLDPALADPAAFKKQVKVLFVSYGSKENTAAAKANHEALEKLGIRNTYYESPSTGHEWQSWRRSLYQFAPLLFRY